MGLLLLIDRNELLIPPSFVVQIYVFSCGTQLVGSFISAYILLAEAENNCAPDSICVKKRWKLESYVE